mmetsp:Transcript_76011/g.246157  ORF Transcript_76011/g.246157 Transcript_76011/m.246157 type:complete len:522 (+) Transcript_76011:41-1606(+)
MGSNAWASFVAVFSALGAFLFGLDIGYIAPILECASFKRDVAHLHDWSDPHSKIPSGTVGFIVGIFSLGCIATSMPFVSSYFLDTWGRRASILIGTTVFLVGCVIQARALSISMMLVGRVVTGGAIGLLSSVVPLYQAEMAPPSMRGALTSLYQLMITAGIFAAAFVDSVLVGKDGGWRVAIWLQVVPAGIIFVSMPFLPRSPRWLVQQGRLKEAEQTLHRIRASSEAEQEMREIQAECEEAKGLGDPLWSEVFTGRVGRLVALGALLQLLQQLVGMNAFMYFGPRIYASLGLNVNLYQTITNAVNFASTFPALFLADRFGRRVLLVSSALGMTVACVAMAVLGQAFPAPGTSGAHVPRSWAAGQAIVAMIFLFVLNFAYGWGPMVWVYNSEIFPLRHRSWCVAATACANWVGNYAIAQLTPVLLGGLGFGTFYVFAMFTLLALALALWLPETKGVMLEHIDEIFDQKFKLSAPGSKAQVEPTRYGAASSSTPEDVQGLVQGASACGAGASSSEADAPGHL